jgi:phosphoglucosamine mutase
MTRYFGTDGIRGVYGSPTMNDLFAQKVGFAIGKFLAQQSPTPFVIIGRDTRPSGASLQKSITQGLLASEVQVHDAGILPTPALAFGVIHKRADFGVMITASHNPHPDNGIKCFSSLGTKLEQEEEETLESLIDQNHAVPHDSDTSHPQPLVNEYLSQVSRFFSELNLSGTRVCLDLANGATCETTPRVFEELGASVVTSHRGEGIINKGCGSEDLQSLQLLVQKEGADLGIAHDGDGDRVRFVDSKGRVVDGDQILGLLALQAQRDGKLNASKFVATIHSNSGLKASLSRMDISTLTSDVGDKNVYLKMLEAGCNWGGESSGHIISTDYLPTGDGLFAALSVLHAMKDQSLLLEDLARQIILWPSLSGSFEVSKKVPIQELPELFKAVQKEVEILKDEGRILLRYSGTEPKIRLLVEATSEKLVHSSFHNLQLAIQHSLSST